MQLFRHKTTQLRFVYFSLFAILMLTLGPFTSQLLAAIATTSQLSSPHQNHSLHNNHKEHHLQANQPTTNNELTQTSPNHHNMNLCGYCDLLHTPVISAYIPIFIKSRPVHQVTIQYHAHLLFLTPYNYPLSQAPPNYS